MINTVSNILFVCTCFIVEGREFVDSNSCRYIQNIRDKRANEVIVRTVERVEREAPTVVINGNNNVININR